MKKYMYIMPSIILLLANSFIVKGVTLKSSMSRKVPEKRSHKTFYEDYYQDVKVPTNYDLDYYPYRSYLYDSNEDPFYEEPHNIVKKHKTKRRGYNKEKNVSSKSNHLNSQKVRIKSQRRSKTNFKTKSRRNVQSMDNSYFVKQYLNNGETVQKENYGDNVNNIRRQAYLPSADDPSENRNALGYGNREEDGKIYNDNYTNNNMGKEAIRQPEIIENYNLEGYKLSNKKSPYDYLHIYNRSHNNFNDINDKLNMKYEFQPNEFNYKSLKRVLGEPIEIQHASQFPQCPAYRSNSRNDAESVRNNMQKESEGELFKGNPRERNNYNGGLLQDGNYFRKRLERSHEEYKSKKQNMRKKRGEKANVFTLTFPGAGENLGSYISLRDWPTEITQNPRCTKCSTVPMCTTCSTTQQCTFLTPTCTEEPTTCTTECTTKCTTTEECTTEMTCATESKCTTCPRNFKELNEGGRIYMDLSNFVSNMFHPLPVYNATLNNNQQSKRQKYMVPYVLQQNTPSISSLNKNNEIKIIKLEPHNLIERSNNNTQDFNDNIYIVKLLKDLSSVGKLTEIPLQPQKSFYSVPYAPRVRRQLAIMKSVGDC
uniref:Putative serine/threonine-protein kinase clka n=1 Tax=Panstrongylus lignarius TaxID=156445 RepID=A0A224XDJ8_9HEMI